MRRSIIILGCLLILANGVYGTSGSNHENICSGDTVAAPWVNSAAPVWKIVFVRFPQTDAGGRTYYPNWKNWMESELRDYMVAMSRGYQRPQVEVVLDPANPSQPWTADHEASFYAPLQGRGLWSCFTTGPGGCNVEIMTKIHNAYPPSDPNNPETYFWHNVNFVSIIQYDNAFACRCGIGGVGGVNGLGVGSQVPGFVEGFSQRGYTSHLYLVNGPTGAPQVCAPDTQDDFGLSINERAAGAQAHEWGHALGFGHSPYTGNPGDTCADCGSPPLLHASGCITPCGGVGQPECEPLYMNIGHYSIMRGVGASDGRPANGLIPIHPRDLAQPYLTWRTPDSTITTNVRGFHFPQIRDASRGKSYYIKPQNAGPGLNADQRFLVANHQGEASSEFDARYGGSGLLIWHILPFRAWDVETPRGKDGNGRDPLERDWCTAGDADDLYDGSYARDNFSTTTNPTSHLYASPYRNFSPQTIASSVGIERIRLPDPGSPYPLDMVADVYVDATQYVMAPNGGELIPNGQPFTVSWLHRPHAGISTVNIAISSNGGVSYAPLPGGTGLTNTTNQYTTPSPIYLAPLDNQWRVQITSFDANGNAPDVSDANFTVWGVNEDTTFQPTISHRCEGTTPKVKVRVNWTTSVPTDGDDQLIVYSGSCPGGTVLGTVTVQNPTHQWNTSHLAIWEGTCSGTPFGVYVVAKSERQGSGWAQTPCKFVGTVNACTSCGGQCTPTPCELE